MLNIHVCLIPYVEDTVVDSCLIVELVVIVKCINFLEKHTFIDTSTIEGSGSPSSLLAT